MANNTPHRCHIACVGLEWRTEVSLKATLEILSDKTQRIWQHTEDTSGADVILYDPSNALAQAMLRRMENSAAPRVLIACGTANTEDQDYLRLPIGATQLLALLDRVTDRIGLADGNAIVQIPLSQKLDEALHKKDVLGVAIISGSQTGFIAPRQKAIYWPKPLDADQIALMIMDGVKVLPFTATDGELTQRFARHAGDMVGWDAAMWTIGSSTATTRLSRHLDSQRTYQITRWPDFGPIGRKSHDLRFISLLSQRPCSPAALAAMPGFTSALANKYFNASALCGILEIADDAPSMRDTSTATAAPSLMSHLVRGLRRAFALEAH